MKGLDLLVEQNINEPINIGSSEAVTMTELADMLLKISGKELEKVYHAVACIGETNDILFQIQHENINEEHEASEFDTSVVSEDEDFNQEKDEELLDIPTYLRRQANR